MNRRRRLMGALGAVALTAPLTSLGQPQGKVWRIGILATGNSTTSAMQIDAFTAGLAKLGYLEGSNISFIIRYADGSIEKFPALAADLVAKHVDVIFVGSSPAVSAAKKATSTIPIVFATVGDPVKSGFVASLGKPGGNITGLSNMAPELAGKRLQILKDILPNLSRIALFTGNATSAQISAAEHAAKSLGMQVMAVRLEHREDSKRVVAQLKEWRADSLNILEGTNNFFNRSLLGEIATTLRLPAIAGPKEYSEAGALISYGASYDANYFRAATYVDNILKGASPGDLPIEQPTKFDLVVNMKTAKALGVKVPQSILLQATKVIE